MKGNPAENLLFAYPSSSIKLGFSMVIACHSQSSFFY